MKLYIFEAFLPNIVVQELDQAIVQWSGSSDPAGFEYLQILQRARATGQTAVIEDVPGDPLNVAEIFTLDEWPRIVEEFEIRRFLADPRGSVMIDVYPEELRALLE